MNLIKNDGIQGIQVLLLTPKGSEYRYLKPRDFVVVPEQSVSEQMKTLNRRRRIRISNYN